VRNIRITRESVADRGAGIRLEKKEQKIIPVKRILQRAIKKNLLSGISIQELRQMLFRIW